MIKKEKEIRFGKKKPNLSICNFGQDDIIHVTRIVFDSIILATKCSEPNEQCESIIQECFC